MNPIEFATSYGPGSMSLSSLVISEKCVSLSWPLLLI